MTATTFPMIRLGDPILRTKSKAVSLKAIKTEKFQKFLDKLVLTCLKNDGVGIAAPQVGLNKKIIVVTVDPTNPRYEDKTPFPLTIVINPKIIAHSKKIKEDWEGDLSVDLRGLVPRPISCSVMGLDRKGNEVRFDLTNDFHARVFQHEIDHLDGIMFIDRVKNKKSFCEYEVWKKYWKGRDIKNLTFTR